MGEDALVFGARLLIHDVRLELFHAQRDGRQGVADEVDPQQLDGDEGRNLEDTHTQEDDDDFGDIRPQQEADHLLDIGVDASAFLDRVDNGRKVVVRERHVRRPLGDVRARDTHRAADVRRLERGRVVDAVARHGDDLSLLLPCLDDPDLVLGRNARIDGDALDLLVQLLVAHRVQLRARDRLIALQKDTQFLSDRGRRRDVVARDHDGLDARLAADGDCRLCLGTGRVDHADEPEEGEPVFQFLAGGLRGDGIDVLIADGEHAERVRAHLLHRRTRRVQIARDAAGRHDVKRALDDDEVFLPHLVDRSHQLAVGIEGNARDAGIFLIEGILGIASLVRGEDNRRLGGVAQVHLFAVFKLHGAVAAQRAPVQKRLDVLVRRRGVERGHFAAVQVGLDERHAVLRQRARLIRADDGSTAQRLHGGQALDDGVLFDHARHADGENDGDDRGKPFGDRRDRQGDRRHEQLQPVQSDTRADNEDDDACRERDNAEVFAQLRKLCLQRGARLLLAREKVCDLAHLRLHARAGDNRRRRAVGDGAARKDHVGAVADGRVLLHLRRGVLLRRHALARERGLFRLQVGALQEPCIGGDKVARFQKDDVAGHQLGRLNDLLLAVADDARVRGGHVLERLQRLFRLALLHEPHDRVEHDDKDDERRLDKLDGTFLMRDKHLITDDAERDARRDEQDDDHDILELL